MESYINLEKLFTKLYRYDHLLSLADWDMNVNMPEKGEEARAEAMATLSDLRFKEITAPIVKTWLQEAMKVKDSMSAIQRANLKEMNREWQRMNVLPADFVVRKTRLTTKAHNVWKKSRATNDFQNFLPTLKELVEIAREEGKYLAAANPETTMTPYEALMNLYEPGLTVARLDDVFGQVKSWLPGLLQKIIASRKDTEASMIPLKTPFPLDKQEALGKHMMEVWNYDFAAGRLDVSPHPFTGMTKEDCRVTTNYNEDVLVQSLYGVIHETGHAKYEQNMGPREMITQPVCNARSLGIHESQSLLAEFQIGRADPFAEFLTPKLIEYFGAQPGFTVENVTKMLQSVTPGYIRVDADEVCYPLHVILRYEIERDLMEGTMEAADVPRVWNEKMKAYLGIETLGKDDKGCLQDVHWSMGSLGYFPTYALGAMFAAQLMASIKKELGEDKVKACLRTGNLIPIFEKQKEKIWDHGCTMETDELMIKATGETLNPEYLRKHLESRYLKN